MPKHTPGPWEQQGDNSIVHHTGPFPEGDVIKIADVLWAVRLRYGTHDAKEGIANARLITAAPELLAACEALIRRWEVDHPTRGLSPELEPYYRCHDCPEIVDARVVVAKAKGDTDVNSKSKAV